MKSGDKKELKELSKEVSVVESKMEFHPSIRALVKILARKAAEEQYEELLKVMRHSFGDDIEQND